MKNKFFSLLLLMAGLLLVLYMAFVFVCLEPNPLHWGTGVRAIFAVCVASTTFALIPWMWEETHRK